MASTVTIPTVNNPASANKAFNANANTGRPSNNRSGSASKIVDASRRQQIAAAFDGGPSRRNNPLRAWTQGTNPITQRPTNSFTQNGASGNRSSDASRTMGPKETNTPEKHANDRMTFLLANFVGTSVTITVRNGDKFGGIFSASTLGSSEHAVMLKMVQKVISAGPTNQANEYIGNGPDHAMAFEVNDIASLTAEGVLLTELSQKHQNGVNSFKTDADISGNAMPRERTLQRWQPSGGTDMDMSLESGDRTGWDQFEANERLYGVRSDYDENIYTTSIDRSDPRYKQKLAEAERIAREIEGSNTTNPHVREERGLAAPDDSGLNEEDKYSGVRRIEHDFPPLQSGQPNKYTPPARRAPSGHPTVSGAPVDPAIISSQLAKPKPAAKPQQQQQLSGASQILPNRGRPKFDHQTPKPPIPKSVTVPKPPLPAKVVAAGEQKHLADKLAASRNITGAEGGSARVVEVHAAFKQFANQEKWRVEESRKRHASHDKAVKINDLMKFSKNFKLSTPVPKDLIPILAKDEAKQKQIIEKAKRAMEEAQQSEGTHATPRPPQNMVETKPPHPAAVTTRFEPGPAVQPIPDRPPFARGRQGYQGSAMNNQGYRNDRNMQPPFHQARGGNGTGMLGHRLADLQQQRKAGIPSAVPAPLPIHDTRFQQPTTSFDHSTISSPHKRSGAPTPTSSISSKFNAKAVEFKPNPNASAFTPTGPSTASSPKVSNVRAISRAQSPSSFFGNKKPIPAAERPSLDDGFNPIKRLKKESEENQTVDQYASNGGIAQAYRTPPTWDVLDENKDKNFNDFFEKLPFQANQAASPPYRATSNPQLPHQHQLPLHLQQGAPAVPQLQTPQTTYQQVHPQGPHVPGTPHFDEHRMQISASTSSLYPSPRLQANNMAYANAAPHPQVAYGQGMPQYVMGAGGPQPAHMGQYPGSPQYIPQGGPLTAPMMVHQGSAGPFLGMPQNMGIPMGATPQMQVYSPRPGFVHPQHLPPQPHSGYPSPRGAPMMMHQGSQQGQHPQPMMFMGPGGPQPMYAVQQPGHLPPMRGGYQQQAHYTSSPRQAPHYPPQPHRAPSGGATQMQPPPPHIYQQAPPSGAVMATTNDTAEDTK